jgi:hypothetical protein
LNMDIPSRIGKKQVYKWEVCSQLHVWEVLREIRPWLGERRRGRCDEVLDVLQNTDRVQVLLT